MIPEPFPFQIDFCQRIRQAAMSGARIIVAQLATGGGKTTVAAHMTKSSVEKGKRSLFLVHRRRLVEQISERLTDFQINHGIIMRGHPYGSALVQVASRDTITSRCFAHEWTGLPPADLIWVDEFHHACDAESDYRRILAQYPRAVIIGLTATPVGPDGKGMGPWAQSIVCAAPTSQLVRDGFLVPVKCYAPDRKKGRGGKFKRGVAGDLVESWKLYAEGMPTVLFCSRVQHSLDAVKAFQEAGIPAAHVDADTDDTDRDKWYAGLGTGAIKIISNVGIIKEGVDIPCLGCCQIFMEMNGRVAFLQAVGRIMRRFPEKTHGVVIDHAGAVFRHGFPDEDTEWTLEGNVDATFEKKHKDGLTAKVLYCKDCEILYKDRLTCPQCGKPPATPPRSIFAPPPVESSNEALVEADRNGDRGIYAREERIKHYFRCLGLAANRGGTFGMASAIYRKKYNEWPQPDFPCNPGAMGSGQKVTDLYPKFRKKRA